MKKLYSILLLVMAMLCIGANMAKAESGFWSDGACSIWLNADGDANWYQSNSSGAAEVNLGTVEELSLKGFWFKMWENTDDINNETSAKMYYTLLRVFESIDESTQWSQVDVSARDYSGWNNGTQNVTLKNEGLAMNLTEGLNTGDYKLVYFFKYGDSQYLSNNSQNYVVNFRFVNALTLGQNHIQTIPAQNGVYYAFEAPAQSVKLITNQVTNNEVNVTIAVYTEQNQEVAYRATGQCELTGLTVGETYWVEFGNGGSSALSDLTVGVTSEGQTFALTTGGNDLPNYDTSDNITFSFLPTADDTYTFSVGDNAIAVIVYANGSEVGFGLGSAEVQSCEAGTIYTVTLDAQELYLIDKTLTVTGANSGSGGSGDTPALTVGPNNLTIPAFTGQAAATFTPAESGNYKFVVSPAQVIIIAGTGADPDPIGTTGEVTVEGLVGNQTYGIILPQNNAPTAGTITVTKVNAEGEGEGGGETPTLPALNVGINNLTFPAVQAGNIATFTPTAPGDYKFEVSPNKSFALFEAGANYPLAFNDYPTDNCFTATGLVAGQTYYINMVNDAVTTGTITVTKILPSGSAMAMGENHVTLAESEHATYTFTPAETGYYLIYSGAESGDIDMYIDGITLDGGSDIEKMEDQYYGNFKCLVKLTADNTYNITIYNDCGGAVEDCKVCVEKAPVFIYTASANMENFFNYKYQNKVLCEEYTDSETPVTVALLDKVTSIEDRKFFAAGEFTSIALPSGVTSIGQGAFQTCSGLTSITLPDGLQSIGEMAFNDCPNLTSITLPSGVETIGNFAFGECTALANVAFNSVPLVGGGAFANCPANITLTLTDGSYVYTGEDYNWLPTVTTYPTYTRQMSNAWGTVVVPFTISYNPDNGNYKLYKLSDAEVNGEEGTLTFTEYAYNDQIPAGIPMAIKAVGDKTDGKYTVTLTAYGYTVETSTITNATVNGFTMKGTYEKIASKVSDAETNVYFIAQGQFWWAEDAISIAPFRAWFETPASSAGGAKSFTIVVDDEATGISAINNEQLIMNNYKFIENGKVVIVRNGKKHNLSGQAIQ